MKFFLSITAGTATSIIVVNNFIQSNFSVTYYLTRKREIAFFVQYFYTLYFRSYK